MSQLRPTIYLSINSSTRQSLCEAIHRKFTETELATLGFTLCWSPRGDEAAPTEREKLASACHGSSVFVLVLDEDVLAGNSDAIGVQELTWALATPGCLPLIIQPDGLKLNEALQRQLQTQGITPLVLNIGGQAPSSAADLLLTTIKNQLQLQALTPTSDQLNVPDIDEGPWQALRPQMLEGKPAANEVSSPLASDMALLKQWALEHLQLGHRSGAEHLLRQCLNNNDVDLFANYQLLLLLKARADSGEEIDEAEFAERIHWVLKQLPADEASQPFRALLTGWQANSRTRSGQYNDAQHELLAATEQLAAPELLEALIYNGLTGLDSNQFTNKQQILLQCKEALYRCLEHGLSTFQWVVTRLADKLPPKTLSLVIHGLRRDVVAHLEPLQQMEHKLMETAEQQQLLAAGQQRTWDREQLRQLPLWNIQQLAFDSSRRQLSILQHLADDLSQRLDELNRKELEQQIAQQRLEREQLMLKHEQQHYREADNGKKQAAISASILLVLALVMATALFWAPWNPMFTAGAFVIFILALAFAGYRWFACRELLNSSLHRVRKHLQHQDGPQPRQPEGWFDRLAVQINTAQEKLLELTHEQTTLSEQLTTQTHQFVQLTEAFESLLSSAIQRPFCPWQAHSGPVRLLPADQVPGLLLPNLLALKVHTTHQQQGHVLARQTEQGWQRNPVYFDDLKEVTNLRWLSHTANTAEAEVDETFQDIRLPIFTMADEQQPVINEWLVNAGEQIVDQQPVCSLQVGEQSVTVHSDCVGDVVAHLATAGKPLHPEQPLLRVKVNNPLTE